MSVALFSRQEFQEIRDSIVYYAVDCENNFYERIWFGFNQSEVEKMTEFNKSSEREVKEAMIGWFVKKLAIANQCAFYYNYQGENPVLEFPEFENRSKSVLSKKELFEKLSNLEYNCIDNNGNNFLPREIEGKLKDLMLNIASNKFLREN